jgi:P-type Mg2+ transporter
MSRAREHLAPTTAAYWSRDAGEVLAAMGTGIRGLTAAAAEEELRRHGANTVVEQAGASTFRLLWRQFESPLVLILIFGALMSLALRDWVEASIILAIVIGSTLLGFAQEYRANTAVAALCGRLALTVQVVRDGALRTIAASALVPGDVVRLAAGNRVPADGLVLEAKDFLVSEASLTGESFPVEKRPGTLALGTPLAARTNCVFLGTSVRSGTASVIVMETGRATAFGAVAARLQARATETEFLRGVRDFGILLMRVMVAMVFFVLALNQWLGRPVLDSLLFAVALAVGITPELLPSIISITLARGARGMARRGVIVRRLEALEDLGAMDVLCTDKTGTLTEGVIALDSAVDADGRESVEVLQLAYLNAAFETGIDNPLDAAIVAAGQRARLDAAGYRKIDEIPYDFIRKRLTIVVADEGNAGGHLVITKGAFATMLAVCAVDPALRERLETYYREKSAQGFRVLALATKRVAAAASYGREDERGMEIAGLLLFFDPPKADAGKTLRDLAALGIQLKVITGDNRHVAAHVAGAVGIDSTAMLTGEQIGAMKDESLWHLAERTALFVEVDPQQKERVVRALQRIGHTVGYLGDGINDAPSLHAADVGISVDKAVDVARESADVVLLRPDLDVLCRGVRDGRAAFANTLKYIAITTSANFGNMVSMALATPLLPFLPLAAKQILLNNFLSDLPSMAICTDKVDAEHTSRAQRWNVAEVRRFMIVFGLVSTAFDLLTFALLLHAFDADEPTFQTAWFIVSLLTELAVLLVLRTRVPAFRSTPSVLLVASTVAVGVIALALPFTGPLARALGFVPLAWPLLLASVLVVGAYVVTTEIAKAAYYRRSIKG